MLRVPADGTKLEKSDDSADIGALQGRNWKMAQSDDKIHETLVGEDG
jgi:hypothetical protein